jgi:hypothetical protein
MLCQDIWVFQELSGADMLKVIIADRTKEKSRRKAKTSVREKRLHRADGTIARVLSLDANSPTFDDDLTYVFEKNVARARRENKKLFGSADGPQAKK